MALAVYLGEKRGMKLPLELVMLENVLSKDSSSYSSYISTPHGFVEKGFYKHSSRHCDIQGITFNSKTQEYIVLDSRGVTAWSQTTSKRLLTFEAYQFNVIRQIVYCRLHNVYFSVTKDYKLKVYNVNFHETFSVCSDETSITYIVFCDSIRCLITSGQSSIRFWQLKELDRITGKYGLVSFAEHKVECESHISRIELDVSLHRLYLLCERDVWCYDFDGVLLFKLYQAASTHVSACCFSPSCNLLVAGDKSGEISILSTTGGTVAKLTNHCDAVTSVIIHPCDDSMFLSASLDGSVKLFSLQLLEELVSCNVYEEGILWMSSVGNIISCTSTKSVQLLHINYVYSYWSMVRCSLASIHVTGSGKKAMHVVATARDSSIRIYSQTTGRQLCTVLPPPPVSLLAEVRCFAYDLENRLMYALIDQENVWLYSTQTNPATKVFSFSIVDILSSIAAHRIAGTVSMSLNQQKDEANVHELSDATFGKIPAKHDDQPVQVCSLEVITFESSHAVDGNEKCKESACSWLACGLNNGYICFLNPLSQFSKEGMLQVHSNSPVTELKQVNKNGDFLSIVSGIENLCVSKWNVVSWDRCWSFEISKSLTCFSSSANLLVFGYMDGCVDIYRNGIKSGESSTDNSREHYGSVSNVNIHVDEAVFCSVGKDEYLRIWTMEKKLVHEIRLNCSLTCASFLNSRGDIVIGYRKQIFFIPNDVIDPHKVLFAPDDETDYVHEDMYVYEDPYISHEFKFPPEERTVTLESYLVPYPDLQLHLHWKADVQNQVSKLSQSVPRDDSDSDSDSIKSATSSAYAPTEIYQDSLSSRPSSAFDFPVCSDTPRALSQASSCVGLEEEVDNSVSFLRESVANLTCESGSAELAEELLVISDSAPNLSVASPEDVCKVGSSPVKQSFSSKFPVSMNNSRPRVLMKENKISRKSRRSGLHASSRIKRPQNDAMVGQQVARPPTLQSALKKGRDIFRKKREKRTAEKSTAEHVKTSTSDSMPYILSKYSPIESKSEECFLNRADNGVSSLPLSIQHDEISSSSITNIVSPCVATAGDNEDSSAFSTSSGENYGHPDKSNPVVNILTENVNTNVLRKKDTSKVQVSPPMLKVLNLRPPSRSLYDTAAGVADTRVSKSVNRIMKELTSDTDVNNNPFRMRVRIHQNAKGNTDHAEKSEDNTELDEQHSVSDFAHCSSSAGSYDILTQDYACITRADSHRTDEPPEFKISGNKSASSLVRNHDKIVHLNLPITSSVSNQSSAQIGYKLYQRKNLTAYVPNLDSDGSSSNVTTNSLAIIDKVSNFRSVHLESRLDVDLPVHGVQYTESVCDSDVKNMLNMEIHDAKEASEKNVSIKVSGISKPPKARQRDVMAFVAGTFRSAVSPVQSISNCKVPQDESSFPCQHFDETPCLHVHLPTGSLPHSDSLKQSSLPAVPGANDQCNRRECLPDADSSDADSLFEEDQLIVQDIDCTDESTGLFNAGHKSQNYRSHPVSNGLPSKRSLIVGPQRVALSDAKSSPVHFITPRNSLNVVSTPSETLLQFKKLQRTESDIPAISQNGRFCPLTASPPSNKRATNCSSASEHIPARTCFSAPLQKRHTVSETARSATAFGYHSRLDSPEYSLLDFYNNEQLMSQYITDISESARQIYDKNHALWEFLQRRKLTNYRQSIRHQNAKQRRQYIERTKQYSHQCPSPSPSSTSLPYQRRTFSYHQRRRAQSASNPGTRSVLLTSPSTRSKSQGNLSKALSTVELLEQSVYEYRSPESLLKSDEKNPKLSSSSQRSRFEKIRNLEHKLSGQAHRFHSVKTADEVESTQVALMLLKSQEVGYGLLPLSRTMPSIPGKAKYVMVTKPKKNRTPSSNNIPKVVT